jgi:Xaa-Pro aminopeptidase
MTARSSTGHPPDDASTGGTPPGAPTTLRDPMDPATRRATVERRLERVRGMVRDKGAGAWWTTSRVDVAWLTAGGQHHVVHASASGVAGILVTPGGAWLVTPTIERDRLVEEEVAGLGFEVETVPWYDPEGPAGAARRLAGAELLDEGALAAELRAARSILDPADIERYAVLGEATRTAVEAAIASVAAGMTEDELAAALLGRLVGIRAPVVLVAADDRIARYRHPLPTARAIERRVMLVLVGEAWGLHVALTRFATLAPDTEDLERRWTAVRAVQAAMTEATRVGSTLGAVLEAAQDAYAANGFPDEWQDHHQGGTIAYQGREQVATPGDGTRIEAGMAFAWNPSIAGVKVEDTFVLLEDGERRWITGTPGRDVSP